MTKVRNFVHLADAESLVTPYANTRSGFVQMALEKSRRASPLVAEARDFGNYFDEARLLNVAHRYQRATDWHKRTAIVE